MEESHARFEYSIILDGLNVVKKQERLMYIFKLQICAGKHLCWSFIT